MDKAGTAMEQVMSDRNMRNLEGTALSGFFKEEIDNMNQKDQSLYKDKVREAGGLNSIDVNNYVENIAKNGNKSTYEVKFDVDGNSVKVGGGTRKIEFSADDISQNNDTYIKVIEAINKNISTETDKKKLENYSSFIKNSLTKDNMKNVTSRTQLETLINTDKTINTEEKNQVRKNLQDQERTFEEN
ncbi:hypothetical protein FACS1894176_03720 [Bacteroidia bacterium]|nr:hypothetical protein FACS1894176_03720 [Bacteroidia bacterium]